jgi:hypothetical protein
VSEGRGEVSAESIQISPFPPLPADTACAATAIPRRPIVAAT